MTIYYIVLLLIGIISIAATLIVGNAQANKEENGQYSKQTTGNILRLSYLNILSLVIWIVIMIIYFVF
ncbi:MAG: hypothetical protein K0S39_1928 [Paenibacillus sp.]|jgi:uncharacterized BrkB/YihY/UPF0761 family membrane protein|nr:hypothetical protein [Paenibacillus sp.]